VTSVAERRHPADVIDREAGSVTRLEDENARLREELATEKRTSAAWFVDADRRERRALDLLPDCDAHKREIQYLRHMASWCWDSAQRAEGARGAIVAELILAARGLQHQAEPVPVHVVAEALTKAVGGQKKALARRSYPTFADCLRAGGCDHDGLSADLKAEIAEAPGSTASEGTGNG
jgi:hypothetical protein